MQKSSTMEIRRYRCSDTLVLIDLFRETVHEVCRKDYSQAQLDAWAPSEIDANRWRARFEKSFTVIAEIDQRVVGFANIEPDGTVDMLYASAHHQSRGVGSRLLAALEEEAKKLGIGRLRSDVSLTARPFFLSKGFAIESEYSKKVGSVRFPNAVMTKKLVSPL